MSNTKSSTKKRKSSSAAKKKSGNTQPAVMKSAATRKTTAARKKITAKERRALTEKERFFEKEAAFILTCFVCLFLFLSNFGLLGKFGGFFEGLQKGLLGYFAYVFPLCIVLFVGFCIRERKTAVFWLKVLSDLILVLTISTMLHLALGSETRHSFLEYYDAGKAGELYKMAAGGALGGFVGDALIASMERVGAWLLMIALFLLSLVVISEKSIINFARRSAARAEATAKAGSVYARDRLAEERIRFRAKREASALRKKELRMEQSLREQEAEVLPPGSSVFDLRAERSNTFADYGNELAGENTGNTDPAENEKEICLKPEEFPQPADLSYPGEFGKPEKEIRPAFEQPPAEISEDIYQSETVPFEETETERYKAYGKMLNSGKIDLDSARKLGFAVSTGIGTEASAATERNLQTPCMQMPAFEREEEDGTLADGNYRSPEEPETLHRPLDPEEIIYPVAAEYDDTAILEEEMILPETAAKETFSQESGREEEEIKDTPEAVPMKKEETVPDYDAMFHITDEERDSVYDRREQAAKKDTAYTPFGSSEEDTGMEISGNGEWKENGKAAGRAERPESGKTGEGSGEKTEKPVPKVSARPYQFPPVALLQKGTRAQNTDQNEIMENARKLERVLSEFGVGVKVTNVVKGPRVTRYEMAPDVGVKVSRITSLSGDIKLAMAASELRIEAPIPGKSAVGIEVPNRESATVTFRDIMETDNFRNSRSKLTWGVGLDIQGDPVVGDIAKMPHLLVSGTTGSGKSVGINSIIMSVIYRSRPEDVRMILVDPKVVELSVYDGIPHLLAPVVTKPDQALAVLNKACAEMARRYNLFKETNTRNIIGYNDKAEEIAARLPEGVQKPEKLPYILIIIDELSELMMHAKKDVESAIVSLTQLARAAGIHLVVATQRPSVDVVTGLIKSNIPSRVAYKLPSGIDSRTVLDTYGAENLLGNGDMLYKPGNLNNPLRVQGAYLSDGEVEEVVEWLKKHNCANYADEWQNLKVKTETETSIGESSSEETDDGRDEYFYEAGCLITEKKKASIGLLQRKFKVGFNRASRIMEQLNEAGVVSDGEGTKERQILMTKEEFEARF